MTQLLLACQQVLTQLERVVNDLSQDDFRRPSRALNGATVGQHIRHTLEFFICLESGFDGGVINYDKRAHNKETETDRSSAITVIKGVRRFLDRQVRDRLLVLEACYQRHVDDVCVIPTSYYRELAYTIEHAVHHMAIMKIAMREIVPNLELDEHFGVAVSTIRYNDLISDTGNQ